MTSLVLRLMVDTTLVEQINALSKVKVTKAKEDEVIKIAKGGDKQAQKYF